MLWRYRHTFRSTITPLRLLWVLLALWKAFVAQSFSPGPMIDVVVCNSAVLALIIWYCFIFVVAGLRVKGDNVPSICEEIESVSKLPPS